MKLVAAIFALIFLGAILWGLRFVPTKQAEDSLVVWWSPDLKLSSLAAIDERLNAPFEEVGVELALPDGTSKSAENCSELFQLLDAGYDAPSNPAFIDLADRVSICRILRDLKRAKPAQRSYLKDFQLNETALNVLPPTVGFSADDGTFDSRNKAAARGISWKQYDPRVRAVTTPGTLELEIFEPFMEEAGDGKLSYLQIMARADFDGDGFEDIIIRSEEMITDGSFADTKLFLLTKMRQDLAMKILETQ